MSDSINEKISSLIDGEQKLDDSLMELFKHNNEAKAKWARYNTVSDVLHDRYQQLPDADWFSSLSAKLDQEPTVLAPRVTRSITKKILKQTAGIAVAASVAMIAVLTVQQNKSSDLNAPASIAQLSTSQSAQIKPVALRLNKATESKLSGYLVNHYEHSVTGKMQGLMPYMRIVSVTPAERIVHEK